MQEKWGKSWHESSLPRLFLLDDVSDGKTWHTLYHHRQRNHCLLLLGCKNSSAAMLHRLLKNMNDRHA
jgi:hypothetical protein